MAVEAYMGLAEQMEGAYNLLREQPPREENDAVINYWTDIGIANIQVLRNISMQRGTTIGAKIRIQHTIALLQSWVTKIRQLQQRTVVTGGNIGTPAGVQWDDVDSAFASRIRTGVVTNLRHKNLDAFLDDVQRVVTEKLELVLREEGNVKVNLILSCKFENAKHEEISTEVKSFNTSNVAILLPSSDINGWFTRARGDLLSKVEDFEQRDSGWSMIEILNIAVNINRYQPLAAGASTFIELPQDIQRKKAVVNVRNEDERCLFWSVIAALHPVNINTERTSRYHRYISELDCTGIKFPATLHDVKKLE